jgi:hypothetical protein
VLANIAAERNNLIALHQQHMASKAPYTPPALTGAEREVLPPEKMSFLDGLEIAQRGTRFEGKISANDPNVARGYQEVLARRQRGE